jgi:hypothetical protein
MKLSDLCLTLISFTGSFAVTHPAGDPGQDISPRAAGDHGSYTVSGLGNRKKAVLNAGGNTLDLAIAMLETEDMTTNYAYGEQLLHGQKCTHSNTDSPGVPGDNKSGDSANFGIFKQNWGMLRVCASRAGFVGQSASQYNNGAKLNSDLYADVAARWDCQNYYGESKWFAGHRNGASGLANPNTDDINSKSACSIVGMSCSPAL